MKYFKLVLLFLLAFIEELLAGCDETCKVRMLASYGLKGMTNPRQGSIVCPLVQQNCCSKEDEMYIHKYYTNFLAGSFMSKYTKINDILPAVGSMMQQIAGLNFTSLAQFFNKVRFCQNISSIVAAAEGTLSTTNVSGVVSFFPNLTTNLTKIFKRIAKIREGFFCTLCDLNTHSSVDIVDKKILYSKSFCSTLVKLTFDSLNFKWGNIYNYLIQYDRILNATLNQSLFTPTVKSEIIKILIAVNKCAGLTGKKNCHSYCGLFYLNENSLLFDGDVPVLENAIAVSNNVFNILKSTPTVDAYNLMINHTVFMAVRSRRIGLGMSLGFEVPPIIIKAQQCSNTAFVFNAENCVNCTDCTNIINCQNCKNCRNCTTVPAGEKEPDAARPGGLLGAIGQGAKNLAAGAGRLIGGLFGGRELYDNNGKVLSDSSEEATAGYEQTTSDFGHYELNSHFYLPTAQMINSPDNLDSFLSNQNPPQPKFEDGNNLNGFNQIKTDEQTLLNQFDSNHEIHNWRILNEKIIMNDPTDIRLNGKNFEIYDYPQEKIASENLTERNLINLTENEKGQDLSNYFYYDVDENGKPIDGPFETEFDTNLPPGSPAKQRKLIFGKVFRGIKNVAKSVVNTVVSTVSNIGNALGIGGNQDDDENDDNGIFGSGRRRRAPRRIPKPTILTDPLVLKTRRRQRRRRRGVDFFATFSDRNVSLSKFGNSLDVIGTYQLNLNLTNFIPDPTTTEQCKIYSVRVNPINLVNYTYEVSSSDSGVNPFDSASDNFFSIQEVDLIAQLYKSNGGFVANAAGLDPSVVVIMEASNKHAITSFLTDYTRGYSPLSIGQPVTRIDESYPRELSSLSIIAPMLMTLMALVLFKN